MEDKNLMLEQEVRMKEKAAALKAEKKVRMAYPMVVFGDTDFTPTRFFRANRQYIVCMESIRCLSNCFGDKLVLCLNRYPVRKLLSTRRDSSASRGESTGKNRRTSAMILRIRIPD